MLLPLQVPFVWASMEALDKSDEPEHYYGN